MFCQCWKTDNDWKSLQGTPSVSFSFLISLSNGFSMDNKKQSVQLDLMFRNFIPGGNLSFNFMSLLNLIWWDQVSILSMFCWTFFLLVLEWVGGLYYSFWTLLALEVFEQDLALVYFALVGTQSQDPDSEVEQDLDFRDWCRPSDWYPVNLEHSKGRGPHPTKRELSLINPLGKSYLGGLWWPHPKTNKSWPSFFQIRICTGHWEHGLYPLNVKTILNLKSIMEAN